MAAVPRLWGFLNLLPSRGNSVLITNVEYDVSSYGKYPHTVNYVDTCCAQACGHYGGTSFKNGTWWTAPTGRIVRGHRTGKRRPRYPDSPWAVTLTDCRPCIVHSGACCRCRRRLCRCFAGLKRCRYTCQTATLVKSEPTQNTGHTTREQQNRHLKRIVNFEECSDCRNQTDVARSVGELV